MKKTAVKILETARTSLLNNELYEVQVGKIETILLNWQKNESGRELWSLWHDPEKAKPYRVQFPYGQVGFLSHDEAEQTATLFAANS